MSYNVKNTAGATVANVPDRFTDRDSTPLALIGYNVTNYGLDHAENFIKLLENFAFEVAPENPMRGQLWYDTANQRLMLYNGTAWVRAGGGGIGSIGDDPTEGGLAGIWHLYIPGLDQSVLLFLAGGKVVMIVSPVDIPQNLLPANVTISDVQYPVSSRFPFGAQAGATLAEDAADYLFAGKVQNAQQAQFAGGGDNMRPAGWAYFDCGADTVGFMIANGAIVCAVANTAVAQSSLPVSFQIEVQQANRTVELVTIQCRSLFAGGLFAGFTFAAGAGIAGFVTTAMVAQMITAESTARASAIEELRVWVDSNSATAQKILTLEAKFTTAAGVSSFAQAIDFVLAQATDTGAISQAVTQLRTEFSNALGVSTWGEALTRLTTISNGTESNSQALTQLQSAFQNTTGSSNFATAIQNLWTRAGGDGASAGWGLSLDVNGYVTGVEAFNGGASNNFFKVTASRFFIADNNIEFIPFEVRNGRVYIKNAVIEDLTLGGEKLIPNAVSLTAEFRAVSVSASSNMGPFPVGNPGRIATGFIPNGTKVVLFLSCNINGGDNDEAYMQIRRIQLSNNGSTTLNPSAVEFGSPDSGGAAQTWIWTDTVPADDQYRYDLFADDNGGVNFTQVHFIGLINKK